MGMLTNNSQTHICRVFIFAEVHWYWEEVVAAANISKRVIKRRMRNGEIVSLVRYVLSFRDPRTKKRTQQFFERQKEAQEAQSKILSDIREGVYANRRETPTIEEAFDHWIADRTGQIKPSTLRGYKDLRDCIVGPLLVGPELAGSHAHRRAYTMTGEVPTGCKLRDMLGKIKISELTTAEIRAWHRVVADSVGSYTAGRCKSNLQTILAMAAEDFNVRPPHLPRRLGRGKPKEKKTILLPEQAKKLFEQARNDKDYGLYYAFPFLTGTRPSEQLGLLWEVVDFEKRTIRICRMQEKDGSLSEITKTAAGTRTIPMSNMLHAMLLDWRDRCPCREGVPQRVFPNIGPMRHKPIPRTGGGNCLLYSNFRTRVWCPALKRAGLPHVTPHSARHFFISTLQAQGIEVGLVAKLAGHANATITLSHYTQAVRGGEEAVEALAKVFQTPGANDMAVETAA